MVTRDEIIDKSATLANNWVKQRTASINKQHYDTMSINPMMSDMLKRVHQFDTDDELTNLLINSHHMIGHNTSFGKMIDEKLLPIIFSTDKFDKKFRNSNYPFAKACFDEIDHRIIVNGKTYLISQKTSKWGIQLTGAVKMNHAFNEILTAHPDVADGIIVGVTYGNPQNLTDKYNIIRGINTGANHGVYDITDKVTVLTGEEFWQWVNGGEPNTYKWIMEGFASGVQTMATDKNL